MDYLRQWLLSVVSCAFLVSLVDQLTPEGTVRQLVRFGGGLVLLLCLLRPLGAAELSELLPAIEPLSDERTALEAQYREEGDRALAAVIAERTGAYIEDKARALGLRVTAKVGVREIDGTLRPTSAVLYGEENAALAEILEKELGIARERQEWRAAE